MFIKPTILTGLKALPNSGRTAKYLRDATRTLTMIYNMPLFPFSQIFPR